MALKKEPEIVVFGSCMIDLICYTSRLPKPGETVHGSDFKLGHGGKGANQCVAAAKLGASTGLIARVGCDSFGKNYKEDLSSLGVNTQHVLLTENSSSGMAQITVSDGGENVIVIVAGANNKLSFDDAHHAQSFLMNAKVVIFQFETPLKSTIETLEFIKNQGGPYTIVNGAPAVKNVDFKVYELCDLFCVNESEGAGDAFIGALAFFTACCPNADLGLRVSRACKVASFSVLKKGTQSSFPSKKDLPNELFFEFM